MTAESTDDRIGYEVSGGIACIRLARPPVNALDLAMVRGVIAALKRAAVDDGVGAVVIASAVAKRFCAGLDIAELAGPSPEEIRTLVHALYVGLFDAQCELGKSSIAAVNGAVRGGGMTLPSHATSSWPARAPRLAIRKSTLAYCRPFTLCTCRALSAATAPSNCSSPAGRSTPNGRRRWV
jgi:1,4-dihydroxy-2-naphthoyl-CoA synthase